ncbi:copper chaperone PCu(A)C [Photobacterium nomapromontoriensis]|uniref:copper chaperone PCu(A)C n=1 Tax=Photobacterium nomapromontoriensis TaxID=2910237 RepID=UPI003D0E1FEE
MKLIISVMISVLLGVTTMAQAHDYKLGEIHIKHPWSKQVPPSSQVAAAFFTVMNHGDTPDELLSASSPIAGKTELHAHIHEDGMMKMRKVNEITILGNETTQLKPGGLHVMFFELEKVPALGESFPLTLHFKQAGTVNVEVKVEEATYIPEGMKKEKMDHSKH